MPKENHLPHTIVNHLSVWQRKLRKLSQLVPTKRMPLLIPAESHGPSLERFHDPEQALVSWRDKQTQAWSLWGELTTTRGRTYFFQLQFLDRHTQNDFFGVIPARWLLSEVLSAQFSLTDALNADSRFVFRHWERSGFFGPARKLAVNVNENGFVSNDRFHIEMDGWHLYRAGEKFVMSASSEGDSVHLELSPLGQMVYHGQSGYAQRGHEAENAAYFSSYTQLQAAGRIVIEDKVEDVAGSCWLDHEKITLPQGVNAQYDRIEIPFPNGESVMLQLAGEFSFGTWVDATGAAKHLIHSEIAVENSEYWKSSQTGARYPLKRTVTLEPLGVKIEIRPLVQAQEFNVSRSLLNAYWSGGIHYDTVLMGGTVSGTGAMHLYGYDQRPRTKVLGFLMS